MNNRTVPVLSDETGQRLWNLLENTFSNIKRNLSDEVIQRLVEKESQFQKLILDSALELSGSISTKKKVSRKRIVIDCDADPIVPLEWTVEEHRKGGQLLFDPDRISLHLEDSQASKYGASGDILRRDLSRLNILNANVLRYLLDHPYLIPKKWRKKGVKCSVFFWGTIYRTKGSSLCVTCLCWDGSRVYWSYHWLSHGFPSDCPAAVIVE